MKIIKCNFCKCKAPAEAFKEEYPGCEENRTRCPVCASCKQNREITEGDLSSNEPLILTFKWRCSIRVETMSGIKDYDAFLAWFTKDEKDRIFVDSILPESEFIASKKG